MSEKEELLDILLSTAIELQDKSSSKKCLQEVDIFGDGLDANNTSPERRSEKSNSKKTKLSIVHSGDTDSSDDEDNKYYEDRKYNQYGKEIKHMLQTKESTSEDLSKQSPTWTNKPRIQELPNLSKQSSTWTNKPKIQELPVKPPVENKKQDVYADPIFGLRIVNPLVSSATLKDRMIGREAVSFAKIKKFVMGNISDKNWVIAGVVVNKSSVRTSQKGSQFVIWTLSDLKDDIKTVSLFVFDGAYKQLWKTPTGSVVGILNPSILDKKDGSKDEAVLGVNNAQKVMILGHSNDLGTCKSTKKNGDRCTAIVNVRRCEFCIYHIKKEYQECSRRSELQSSFAGKGLTALRNKVLGKNEVFYAGKLYTAIPAKRSKKLEDKDNNRLQSLNSRKIIHKESVKEKNLPKKKAASNLEVSQRQRLKDLELLEKLGGPATKIDFNASHSLEVTPESSKSAALNVIAKLKAKNQSVNESDDSLKSTSSKNDSNLDINKTILNQPKLGISSNKIIDLNKSITPQQISRAKLNAMKYIQKHGPLKKDDPNSVKKVSVNRKRPIDFETTENNNSKKPKVAENEFMSDRFKKIMEATSKHVDLLDDKDNEEQDKYFRKLEMKEQMEEKMVNTYKVPCKAVQCLKCKYTNFSASQFCKDEKHPLKVYDAFKRFFKCGNCGNRIPCLDVVPTVACKNCGSGKWERTGMMKEKTAVVCKKFNEVGSRMLSRGFIQLEKLHAVIYKRVKALLPRRESERRVHPLSRHCDILQAVETRISMLSMTYMKYIENNLLCFIPGKVLDEMINVLRFVQSDCTPPRTHQLLQELRDLSSMAMEHFDEHILPRVKEHKEQMDERRQTLIASLSGTPSNTKQTRPFFVQQANDLQKIKKQYKTYKHHIAYLNQNTQKLILKMKRQNKRLKAQSIKIRDQERKIQEQSAKIQEQEAALADIKKHMDEWDQKYKDLTTELMRARDYILLKTSPSSKPTSDIPPRSSPAPSRLFKSCIKPRMAQILPKNYNFSPLHLDLERKRKSNLLPDIPVKMSRSRDEEEESSSLDKLIPLKEPETSSNSELKSNLSSLIETLISAPLTSIKSRKRKIAEDIDLK